MIPKHDWHEPAGGNFHKSLISDSGILAPNGVFYGCDYGEHSSLARDLEIPDTDYESYGFMHVRDGWWSDPPCEPTQAQIDTIFDWCHHHHRKLPAWATTAVDTI